MYFILGIDSGAAVKLNLFISLERNQSALRGLSCKLEFGACQERGYLEF